MTKPRYEAAGRYVIDCKRKRICSFGDPDSAAEVASRWNANDFRDEPEECEWHFEHMPPTKPDDCPDHYWAEPYECMTVRNALLDKTEPRGNWSAAFTADWAALWGYVWRCMFKGQAVDDLRKIEHYARILRERLEGRK